MALENYQPEEEIQQVKEENKEGIDNSNEDKADRQILEIKKNIEGQVNKIKDYIKDIKNNILKQEIENKIKEVEQTLENKDITIEQLKELGIKITEVIETIRNENKDLIEYIEKNDITKEEIPQYGMILLYAISIKDLPSKQMERKLEEKETELKIDINKLFEKNNEEKILIINELSKSYGQETLYEMSNMIGLPAGLCETEDEEKIFYIENEKGCIITENGEMQYYNTIQEAIINKTAKNLIINKKQSNTINFSGKGTGENLSNEIRDEYNNEGQLDNTTLTTKDKKSYKATRKIKAPIKGLTASTFMKGNRYTGNKLIEKEGNTTWKNLNGGNMYVGGNIGYNTPINETTLTISATVQKNITKKNSTIEFTVEAGVEHENLYMSVYYNINKYGEKIIGANLEYSINERFSISGDVGNTHLSGKQNGRSSGIYANLNMKGIRIQGGYDTDLGPNARIIGIWTF